MKRGRKTVSDTHPLISKREWAVITRSVIEARENHLDREIDRELLKWEKLLSSYRPAPIIPIYPGAQSEECRREFLYGLARSRGRSLNSERAQRAIQLASNTDDAEFFILLGKALKLDPIAPHLIDECKVRSLLLSEWIQRNSRRLPMSLLNRFTPHSDLPPQKMPLCLFSNAALAEYCRKKQTSSLTDYAVIKIRERLGLIPAKKKRIRSISPIEGPIRYVRFVR